MGKDKEKKDKKHKEDKKHKKEKKDKRKHDEDFEAEARGVEGQEGERGLISDLITMTVSGQNAEAKPKGLMSIISSVAPSILSMVSGHPAPAAAAPQQAQAQPAHGQAQQQSHAPQPNMNASQVIFFPDEKLPCRNGANCHRKQCNFAHEMTSLSCMIAILMSATKSLDICVFSITIDDLADAVIAVHRKGIAVRIITDDDQRKSQGSDIDRMAQAGIPVKDDNSKFHMHHKFAVVDDRLLLNGSFNWTRQAVLSNRENVVISPNQPLIQSFKQEFEDMWSMY